MAMTSFIDDQGSVTRFGYNIAGWRIRSEFATKAVRTRVRDAAGQIITMIDTDSGGPNQLQRFDFGNDAVGNRHLIVDSNGAHTTYTYDGKNRLTQDHTAGTNAHTYDYSYDGNDNRLTSSETGEVTTFAYGPSNQLVTSVNSAGTTTYTYDDNGSLIRVAEPTGGAVTTMTYDKESRLQVHDHWDNGMLNPRVTTYAYEGGGLKRVENVQGQLTTLVWDGDDYLQGRS